MALSDKKLEYTKRWTNPADFPTYESREEKVRSDMQLLFDEVASALNALIDYLSAEVIPFNPTAEIPANNLQDAIMRVQSQIIDVVDVSIPDRSLPGEKLTEGAVGTIELADDAVTQDKLADDSVGGDQLIDGSVTHDKLASEAVGPENLRPGILPDKADLVDGIISRSQRRFRNKTLTSTSYTLALNDAETVLLMQNAEAGTVTVPANATAGINVGAVVVLVCAGEQFAITPASGVELFTSGAAASGNVVIKKKGTVVQLFKCGTNSWYASVSGIREGEVGTSDLGSGIVRQENMADNSVGTDQLIVKSVTTGIIADRAVTFDKTAGIQKEHTAVNNVSIAAISAGGTKTVTVNGVTASNTVIVSPAPGSWAKWRDCGVRCSAQGANSLTFTAESATGTTLYADVVILD